jgi:glutamate dehydrogenase
MDLYERVLASRIPDLPLFQPFLVSYFPATAAAKYKEQVAKHHLRREIIATVVTNAMINQAGCSLLIQLSKETSAPLDELVVRYFMIDELLGGREIRAAIHAADYKVAAADQYAALLSFEDVHRSLMRWWIWNENTWKLGPDDIVKAKPKFVAASEALVAALEPAHKQTYDARLQDLTTRGFGQDVAVTLARGPMLREAFALLAVVNHSKTNLDAAAPALHRVGRELHVDAFDEILSTQVPANPWERRFYASLEREASSVRQQAISRIAAGPDFVDKNRDKIDRIADGLSAVRQLGAHGLVPLFLILEDYRSLT